MNEIENIKIKYKDKIDELIKSNNKFYQFQSPIPWQYADFDTPQKYASCRADGSLNINPEAILNAEKNDAILYLEYFILHEIRHSYQKRLSIYNYEHDIQNPTTEEWIYNINNPIDPSKDEAGYFYQLNEIDAFAFSYAVIQYKYKNNNYIRIPSYYINYPLFNNAVCGFLKIFASMNL